MAGAEGAVSTTALALDERVESNREGFFLVDPAGGRRERRHAGGTPSSVAAYLHVWRSVEASGGDGPATWAGVEPQHRSTTRVLFSTYVVTRSVRHRVDGLVDEPRHRRSSGCLRRGSPRPGDRRPLRGLGQRPGRRRRAKRRSPRADGREAPICTNCLNSALVGLGADHRPWFPCSNENDKTSGWL